MWRKVCNGSHSFICGGRVVQECIAMCGGRFIPEIIVLFEEEGLSRKSWLSMRKKVCIRSHSQSQHCM